MRKILLLLFFLLPLAGRAADSDSLAVYVFLSESCPICQNMSPELKRLAGMYEGKPVSFTGLFPNVELSDDSSIAAFRRKYRIPFDLRKDPGGAMTRQLGATITPEVFLVRVGTGEVLYQGRIDNSYEAVNRRRSVVTAHYLEKAIASSLQRKPADPVRTKAVGCLILTTESSQ